MEINVFSGRFGGMFWPANLGSLFWPEPIQEENSMVERKLGANLIAIRGYMARHSDDPFPKDSQA
jgi:hypothetical protein